MRDNQHHRGGGGPRVRVSFCFFLHHHLASSSSLSGKRRSISSLSLSFSRSFPVVPVSSIPLLMDYLSRSFSLSLYFASWIDDDNASLCLCSLTFTHKMYTKQDEAAPMGGQQQQHPPRGPPPGMGGARAPPGFGGSNRGGGYYGGNRSPPRANRPQMMMTQQQRAQSRDRYPADDDHVAEDGEVGELPPPGMGRGPPPGMMAPPSGSRFPPIPTGGRTSQPRAGFDEPAMASAAIPANRPSLLAQTQHQKKYVPPQIPGDGGGGSAPVGPPPGVLKPPTTSGIRGSEGDLTSPSKKKLGWGRSLKPQQAPPPKKEENEEDEEKKVEKEKEEEEEKPPFRLPSAPPVAIEKKAAPTKEEAPTMDDKELKKLKAAENRLKTTKAALVAQMDRVDETVVELEKELEALVDQRRLEKQKDKEDRDGDSSDLRYARRETELLRNRLQTAEKQREQRELFVEERNQEARELANRERELKDIRKASASETEKAARFLANRVCREMCERDKKKVSEEIPKQFAAENKNRHDDAEERITSKDHISLPSIYSIPKEQQTNAADIAKRVYDEENDEKKRGKVREQIMNVLRKRKKKLNEYEYTLALQYLKYRERWRVSLMFKAAEKERRERLAQKGNRRGITGMGGGPSSSSRNRSDSRNQQVGAGGGVGGLYGAPGFGFGRSDGVARSEYEEMQMIKALQRKEELKTLCKVPDMILDEHERRIAIFDSRNGLVEDPKAEHDAEKFIRPWTEDEIRVYHEKFTAYGKNFRRIAKHLPGRDTADCVVYYYRNQKTSDGFKARRKAAAKKRKMYNDARRSGATGLYSAPPEAIAQTFKEREETQRSALTAEARLERAALAQAAKAAKAKKRAEKREREGGGNDNERKGSFSELTDASGEVSGEAKRQKA